VEERDADLLLHGQQPGHQAGIAGSDDAAGADDHDLRSARLPASAVQQGLGGDLGADVVVEAVVGIHLVLGDVRGVPGSGVDARRGDVHDPPDAVAAGVGEHVGGAGDVRAGEVPPTAPGGGQRGTV